MHVDSPTKVGNLASSLSKKPSVGPSPGCEADNCSRLQAINNSMVPRLRLSMLRLGTCEPRAESSCYMPASTYAVVKTACTYSSN